MARNRRLLMLITACALAALLEGCIQPKLTPTPSPTAGATASPTGANTPLPAATVTASPTATATPTPTLDERPRSGDVISGRNFTLYNENPALRVAIDPAWSLAEVERLVDLLKPGWRVAVHIVAAPEQVPLRAGDEGHGYPTHSGGALFCSEMPVYEAEQKVATYYYYPAGDHFRTIGRREVEPGAAQVADFSFSFKFLTFLAMDSPAYLLPGAPEIPPAAAAERDAHSGSPRFSGGNGAALFHWELN